MFGLSILWSGCAALRVAIPKEAQVFRDKIISDALSYSYSALEFGAPNDTQFKSWSLVKNLSHGGHVNKSQYEYGIEDNRWGKEEKRGSQSLPSHAPRKQKTWPNHQTHYKGPPPPTKKAPVKNVPFSSSSAAPPARHQSLRPTFNPTQVSDIYPQYGFHPLLFSTPSPVVAKYTVTPFGPVSGSLSDSPGSRIVLTGGISVSGGNGGSDSKKASYKQLGRLKKGKSRNRFRKGKLRPVGLDHFNLGVQQAIHVSSGGGDYTTTDNPFPNLSPGYSRVTQNLPNSLPAVVYGTNHLEDRDNSNSNNNSWIPIVGPSGRNSGSGGGGGGNNNKGKKGQVNLTRILKNKSRPRHRYSSNYSSRGTGKVRSHRLAGILSQSQKALTGGAGGDGAVFAVYPNNKNYSTVTARSRALATTTTDNSYDDSTSTTRTTKDEPRTTTEAEIIHARITKIPNLKQPQDVLLNVTTQFPTELDDKVRARLKAIRKIVRRLP